LKPSITDTELKSAGYKFIGWMNEWEKPFPMEFLHCVNSSHVREEVSFSNRGSNNTVYCEICKIYWKYDCSD
jgi:hypothetical protein